MSVPDAGTSTSATDGGTATATVTVKVKATEPAKVAVPPAHYWEYPGLNLYFTAGTGGKKDDVRVDDAGAKKFKLKADTPVEYIKELQTDLIALGYLAKTSKELYGLYGGQTARAVTRFQRHAKRVYRMIGDKPDDVDAKDVFAGSSDGVCKADTAQEVRKWIEKKWVLPLGRIPLRLLNVPGVKKTKDCNPTVREDVADEWEKIVKDVADKGGTLEGQYGDCLRDVSVVSSGSSTRSLHFLARAIDLDQSKCNGRKGPYFILPLGGDPPGLPGDGKQTQPGWKILCRTEKQDGTQGTLYDTKPECWAQYGKAGVLDFDRYPLPKGYYLDLTNEIQSSGKFNRIRSRKDWKTNSKSQEWWHFQFIEGLDADTTLEDELELIGISEETLRSKGQSDADMDVIVKKECLWTGA